MHANGTVHHIELFVSDLARSDEFWGWLLSRWGYVEYQRWDGGVSYRFGATYLVLVQAVRELERGYHRSGVGLNHLAFHAESEADVDALTEALTKRGATILYSDRHPYASGEDTYAVFFEDPDRIKVEFVVSSS